MLNDDNLIETIIDDVRNTSVEVDNSDTGCPFTHPEDYTFMFSVSTKYQYKDARVEDKSKYMPSYDELNRMLRILEEARNAGVIRSYSKVYMCWTKPDFWFLDYNARKTMDVYAEAGSDDFRCMTGQYDDIDRNAFFKIKIGIRIDHVSVYLPYVLSKAGDELLSISSIIATYDAYMLNNDALDVLLTLRNVTNRPNRNSFIEGEWPLPIYESTLENLCKNYIRLRRMFTGDDIYEMKSSEIKALIRNLDINFQSRIFRTMETYMDSPIERFVESGELLGMFENMEVSDDRNWAAKKYFIRLLTSQKSKQLKCFYSRENISYESLGTKTYMYDFVSHVNIDEFISRNSLEKVIKVDLFNFKDKECYGFVLWHGLTDNPVTTVSIGFIFSKQDIEIVCKILNFIYLRFDSELFKRHFK
jgi:hypothetical protein